MKSHHFSLTNQYNNISYFIILDATIDIRLQ